MSKHRYGDGEAVSVDAAFPDFTARVSGAAAHGQVFLPHCMADVGEKLRLRIRLDDGSVVKAEGRVAWHRRSLPTPGCGATWITDRDKSVNAVRMWISRQGKSGAMA